MRLSSQLTDPDAGSEDQCFWNSLLGKLVQMHCTSTDRSVVLVRVSCYTVCMFPKSELLYGCFYKASNLTSPDPLAKSWVSEVRNTLQMLMTTCKEYAIQPQDFTPVPARSCIRIYIFAVDPAYHRRHHHRASHGLHEKTNCVVENHAPNRRPNRCFRQSRD